MELTWTLFVAVASGFSFTVGVFLAVLIFGPKPDRKAIEEQTRLMAERNKLDEEKAEHLESISGSLSAIRFHMENPR